MRKKKVGWGGDLFVSLLSLYQLAGAHATLHTFIACSNEMNLNILSLFSSLLRCNQKQNQALYQCVRVRRECMFNVISLALLTP